MKKTLELQTQEYSFIKNKHTNEDNDIETKFENNSAYKAWSF